MSSCTSQGAKLLYGFQKDTRLTNGLGAMLPAAYMKYYKERYWTKPTAVHWIPQEGKYERNELTGLVRPIQNVPIQVIYPPEHNNGIWGGEGVVQGFQKRKPTKRRVPHYWVPVLRRTVVHSRILNEYMSTVVTNRTMDLIHESHGFDHYILKTLACDLKSNLALTIKRKILQELEKGCPALADNPNKQNDVLSEYKPYLENYTSEEIEWYGYRFLDAIMKLKHQLSSEKKIEPLKIQFRKDLIEELKNAELNISEKPERSSSWLSKINPFQRT